MSLQLIAAEISRFLASKDPEIICVKGRWGVGKTYAWRRFLREAQRERRIGYEKYSYISLFGRNSLADLRNSITENTVSAADVDAKPSISSLDNATSLIKQGAQRAGFFASLLPQSSGYAQLGQRMLYLFLRNTIVCLDDIERAGVGLNVKDVLGLASQLKDEKSCKVVILLNDEKLSKEHEGDFRQQLEKVVDVVINFELSAEEAADIALSVDMVFHEVIRENCIKLKLDNIRVIKKAEQFCARLVPLLNEFDERLLHQAVHTATLACYAKYQPDKAPSFDFIQNFNPWDAVARTLDGNKTTTNPDYITVQEYGLTSIDEFDQVILSAVDRGFFDQEQLVIEAKRINENLRSNDMKADYDKAWELYRSSFVKNEVELVDALVRAVENNISVIDLRNIDSVVSVLRDIGYSDKATALIKLFMEIKEINNIRYWSSGAHEYHGSIRDNEIASAIEERRRLLTEDVDPVERLKKVGERDGWSEEDEASILRLCEDDIVTLLHAVQGENLNLIVNGYRLFLSISNPSPNVQEICRRAKFALNKIAGESKLNARRVKSMFYNVNLDV